jgi:hypothetical protein
LLNTRLFFTAIATHTHIATRHGAYLFFFQNLFLFVNFKFWSFAMVIFASELIPAMEAPAVSVDLLDETCEKAADAHTTASSIWDILNYFASPPWRILSRRVVPLANSAT